MNKRDWLYKICINSPFILIPLLIVLLIVVLVNPSLDYQILTIATIVNAIAVTALAALTYIYAYHTRELAEITREQVETSNEMVKVSEKSIAQAYEQSNRMFRPIIIPSIETFAATKWKMWEGKINKLNGGNGLALEPRIKILDKNDKDIFKQNLGFNILISNAEETTYCFVDIPNYLNTDKCAKLEYTLEVYWRSVYEMGHTKAILPFSLSINKQGDIRLEEVGIINIILPSILKIETD